jgi:hypothetical protein
MGKDYEGSGRGLVEGLFRNWLGGTEENYQKPQSAKSLSRPIFESEQPPNTSVECKISGFHGVISQKMIIITSVECYHYTFNFSCSPCPSWQSSSFISACHYSSNRRDLTRESWLRVQSFRFVCESYRFRTSGGTLAILTRFSSLLRGKFRDSIVSQIWQRPFPFKFVVHKSLYNLTLWNLSYWQHC